MAETGILNNAFQTAYAKLNSEQKRAVDSIEGPVMVIAGPGTGKTQILALRIANILLKTDTKPENILALTFTEAGAHAMKERLRGLIGDTAYKVAVHTFHSFAGALIHQYPDAFPLIIGGRPANDIDKLGIVESILENSDFKYLRPLGDPLYYATKIPHAIADLKKEYLTPDKLAQRISGLEKSLSQEPQFHDKGAHKGKPRSAYLELQKRIDKLRELNTVYRQYEAELRNKRLFDFEDMILEAVQALQSNEGLRLDLQEKYQYILADEHQDVNQAQNQILELLASYHEAPNLFVVGDEKQAIYRFQGASLDNFLFFENKFKGTKVISLTKNYRSTQAILDASHLLIKTDDEELNRLRIPLEATTDDEGSLPEFRSFAHSAVEDDWVVGKVKELWKKGIPLSDIAVIVRFNRDVEHLAELLRRNGIDVNASAEGDILDHPITKSVESLLSAATLLGNEALFDLLTGGWWNFSGPDLFRLLSSQNREWPLYRLISDEARLQEIGILHPQAFVEAHKLLEEARAKAAIEAPHNVLQYLIEKSGLLTHVMKNDPVEGVRVLRRLYDNVESMVINDRKTKLSAIALDLQYRRRHGLPLTAPLISVDKSAVNVMTAHKSKGLEFHTVIIPRATDEAFGKVAHRDLFKLPLLAHDPLPGFSDTDDDRRLLYVAMTRAKVGLFVSSSETDSSGKLREPSRFLSEIDQGFITSVSTEREGDEFNPANLLASTLPPFSVDSGLIRELFLARGFSVTHLNNYLEDPLKYFNENLLRRPHPRSLALLRGEAVHEVLEKAVQVLVKENRRLKDQEVADLLSTALRKLPLSLLDESAIHEKAFAALIAYLPAALKETGPRSQTELSLSITLETGDSDLPEITLTGKIDRVDYNEDGSIARVTDYKTGKPKSRNEIEGLTKGSLGAYKRQLVFYALLLSLYNKGQTWPGSFVLSFVEPKERSGEIVEHTFSITPEEVEELKTLILKVAKEIVSGEKFLAS